MPRRSPVRPPVLVAVAGFVLLAVFGLVLALGSGDSQSRNEGAWPRLVSVDAFASRLEDPGAFLVNVHIPYEGEIEGTDAFIPFDDIVGDERLPSDPSTPLLVYCRSGRMSAIATAALVNSGYTDVTDLDGGMIAWEADGRAIIDSPST